MRSRTCLLIEWALIASMQLIGIGCGGSEIVRFNGTADGGPDGTSGTGGSATGGGAGTGGASGAAGTGGVGTAGTGGTSGGGGGASGRSGASGSGGATGTSGASGSGGATGTSGASGASGAAGTSGGGGASGASGASGAGGASGASGGDAGGAAGRSGSAGSVTDAGRDRDVNTADLRADGDVATDVANDRAGDAGCPDIFGTYEINNADGSCGNLDENAPQEIRGTTQACFLHFISVVDGGIGAVNGGATLEPNGTFSGATLILGTATRSPCTGSWDANQQELTVVCGSGTDECSIELRRSGP